MTVYSIPAGTAFVDALAAGLMDGTDGAPDALADHIILLPTRRGRRALSEAFLRQTAGKAVLLPRMLPLGDVDEDEFWLGGVDSAALDLPPAITATRRRLLLAKLVRAAATPAPPPDQALALADELARLLDQIHTARLTFDKLPELVDGDYAAHWQITLEFLSLLTEHWPKILADEGCVDPAWRQARLLEAQAEAWRNSPPQMPVIAAGSTGTLPATADLLAVIAGLPNGAVVLPGFDPTLPPAARAALAPTHPQYGMDWLLRHMAVDPETVQAWPGTEPSARGRLATMALWPTETDPSGPLTDPPPEAWTGLTQIAAGNPAEEAGAIALMMRETLETPGKTAALVTPDRDLARRVAAELERWGIQVDDSAGQPLATTALGSYLRLIARAAASGFAPVDLLACCKHPLAAGGRARGAFLTQIRRIERAVLRGARPAPGLENLAPLLEEDQRDLAPVIAHLEALFAPLSELMEAGAPAPLETLFTAHLSVAEALAATDTEAGADRLWVGDAGTVAVAFAQDLLEATRDLAPVLPADYPALLEGLMAGQSVRPRRGAHPRLAILGLLEARLQQADLMILGGLNEGTWPPEAAASPWMSRPMMQRFGLPLPERRIGLTAHDFVQAFSAPRVVVTRATRAGGTPTVPARWLQRLENLRRGQAGAAVDPGPWLAWRAALEAPLKVTPISAPAPRPPVAARPRELSVTQVETWMRDPYAIYARKILDLEALDPLDADPGAADYGTVIHDILDRFVRAYPEALPENAQDILYAFGQEHFAELLRRPGPRAFWWPKFLRIADWFLALEAERRPLLAQSVTETWGYLTLDGHAGPFRIKAKADRIDRHKTGRITLIDYKTGATPTETEVAAGFAPQLPLEAAMARAGGFDGIAPGPLESLEYWKLMGRDVAGKRTLLKGDPEALADQALEGVGGLIRAFDDPATPYEARPRPDAAPRYSDYEHLARIAEWATAEDTQ